MSVQSKNPTGVYVVAPDGRIVVHPVHTSPGVDFPGDDEIAETLKPGWRFARAVELEEAEAHKDAKPHVLAKLAEKRAQGEPASQPVEAPKSEAPPQG